MALLGERAKSSRPSPRAHVPQSHGYNAPFIGPQLPPASRFNKSVELMTPQDVPTNSKDAGAKEPAPHDRGKRLYQADADTGLDDEDAQNLLPLLETRWVDDFNGRSWRVAGLQNNANNCYLNSVLQCLSFTVPFANLCLRKHHSKLCKLVASVRAGQKFTSGSNLRNANLCAFCLVEERVCRHLLGESRQQAPLSILNNLRVFAPTFKINRQEDAHEFLRLLIEACSKACVRLHLACRGQSESCERKCVGVEEPHTVVREIFGGVLQSQVKCLDCQAESNRLEVFMDLSLEINRVASVDDALQRFTQVEMLDGENKYACEKCKKLSSARKQFTLLSAPNILVIQLKRFCYSGSKINANIKFGERLALSKYMSENTKDMSPEYMLYGVIVHQGASQDMGHYFAYVKDQRGQWHLCNDFQITPVNISEVLRDKAYMLFYARTDTRPVGATMDLRCGGNSSPANPAPPPEPLAPTPFAPASPSVVFATPATRPYNRLDNGGPAKQPVRRGPVNGTLSTLGDVTPLKRPPLNQARSNGQLTATVVNATVAKKLLGPPPPPALAKPLQRPPNGSTAASNGNGAAAKSNGNGAVKQPGLSPGSYARGLAQLESESFDDDDDSPIFVQEVSRHAGASLAHPPGGPTHATPNHLARVPTPTAAARSVTRSPPIARSLFGNNTQAGEGQVPAYPSPSRCQTKERATPTWPPVWMARSRAEATKAAEERLPALKEPPVIVDIRGGDCDEAGTRASHSGRVNGAREGVSGSSGDPVGDGHKEIGKALLKERGKALLKESGKAPMVVPEISLVKSGDRRTEEMGDRCRGGEGASCSGAVAVDREKGFGKRENGYANGCSGLEAAAEAVGGGKIGGGDRVGETCEALVPVMPGGVDREVGGREAEAELGSLVAGSSAEEEGGGSARKRKVAEGRAEGSAASPQKRARVEAPDEAGLLVGEESGRVSDGALASEGNAAEGVIAVAVAEGVADGALIGAAVKDGLEGVRSPSPVVELSGSPANGGGCEGVTSVAVDGGVGSGLMEVGDGAVAVVEDGGEGPSLAMESEEEEVVFVGMGRGLSDAVVPDIDSGSNPPPLMETRKVTGERGGAGEKKSLYKSEEGERLGGGLDGEVPAVSDFPDVSVEEHLTSQSHVRMSADAQVPHVPHCVDPDAHVSPGSDADVPRVHVSAGSDAHVPQGHVPAAPQVPQGNVFTDTHMPQRQLFADAHVPQWHVPTDSPVAQGHVSADPDACVLQGYVPADLHVPQTNLSTETHVPQAPLPAVAHVSQTNVSTQTHVPRPQVSTGAHVPHPQRFPDAHVPQGHVSVDGHVSADTDACVPQEGRVSVEAHVPEGPLLGVAARPSHGSMSSHVGQGHVTTEAHVPQRHVSVEPQVAAPVLGAPTTCAVTQGSVTVLGRVTLLAPKESGKGGQKRKKPESKEEFTNRMEQAVIRKLRDIGWCTSLADKVHFERRRQRLADEDWSENSVEEQVEAVKKELHPKLLDSVPESVKKWLFGQSKKFVRSQE